MLGTAALAVACSGGSDPDPGLSGAPAAPSTTVEVAPTTTIAASPRTLVTLPSELAPGEARVGGTVTGPDGPVPDATVRVERLVDDEAAASTTVQSGPDGRWGVEGVNGGRYRLRAWKAPDLAQLTPAVVFVSVGESPPVDLPVLRYPGDGNVVAQVSPEQPMLGQPAIVVVSVSNGGVDTEGILRAQVRQAVPVGLGVSANVAIISSPVAVTDGNGNAGFQIVCNQPGPIVAVTIVDAVQRPVSLPACR